MRKLRASNKDLEAERDRLQLRVKVGAERVGDGEKKCGVKQTMPM